MEMEPDATPDSLPLLEIGSKGHHDSFIRISGRHVDSLGRGRMRREKVFPPLRVV